MKRIAFALGIVAAALAGGVTAYFVSQSKDTAPTTRIVEFAGSVGNHFTSYEADKYPDLTYAAENAVASVVNIEKIEEVQIAQQSSPFGFDPFWEFFGIPQEQSRGRQQAPSQERRSGGSGVIISPDGYIVTNNHVVENASKLKVTLNDERQFEAKLIGTDPTTDIALIKIEAEDLPTLPFGNSDDLRLGEWVLAIGSPYGLQSTVTAGIVSAKARNLAVIPDQFRIESFIQTDAAVNPGNSGGALTNVRGELVGINTVIKSPTGSYAGYSFAVPTTIVKKVVVDLKEYGVVQRARLGISITDVTADFIEREGKEKGITEVGGIYVANVEPDGAAAVAGIKEGDIITEFNGTKIAKSSQLLEQVATYRPNDKVTITAKRGNDVKQFEVTLRNKAGKTELVSKDDVDAVSALGGRFADLSDREKKALKINGGARVVEVSPSGILSKAGVEPGFVITRINDSYIRSSADLTKIDSQIYLISGINRAGVMENFRLMQN